MQRDTICLIVVLAISIVMVAAPPAGSQDLPEGVVTERIFPTKELPDAVVAEVNGKPISVAQFFQRLVIEAGQNSIGQLVKEEIVRQEAEAAGVHFLAEEVDRETEALLAQAREDLRARIGSSSPGLEEVLSAAHVEWESFLSNLQRQAELQMKLESLVLLERMAEERIELRIIQLRTADEARKQLHLLGQGADFAALAAKHSVHRTSESGGLVPPFARGFFKDPYLAIEEAAFALEEPGDTSGIVKVLNEGNREDFFLLRLVRRIPAREGGFQSRKEEVIDLRRSDPPRGEELHGWMSKRLDEAKVFVDIQKDVR